MGTQSVPLGCSPMAYHPFPQPRWTLVLSARSEEAEASSTLALEELTKAYWKPVYAFLCLKGFHHEDAQDETQAFFEHLIKRNFLRNLEPQGGRFRNFLLVSLRCRLIDEHARLSNRKRRAEVALEPWHDSEAASPYPEAATPEEAFDRSWAEELVARAMAALQERWEKRSELFAELRFTVESPGDGAKYAVGPSRLREPWDCLQPGPGCQFATAARSCPWP